MGDPVAADLALSYDAGRPRGFPRVLLIFPDLLFCRHDLPKSFGKSQPYYSKYKPVIYVSACNKYKLAGFRNCFFAGS